MAINTEKNTYTLLFAIGLVVIVGTLLAAIDASLKDKIRVNKTLEKQQNILYAIGCLLYTSPSPRDAHESRMPSSA